MRARWRPRRDEHFELPDLRAPAPMPFVIAVDQREQHPYTFQGIEDRGRRLKIDRRWSHLSTGDYSIVGQEKRVCIERKSLADLFGTLSSGRDRFKREHERMAEFDFAAVAIEATWGQVLAGYERSRLNPETVWRTALSWPLRYGVHWYAFGDRRTAEVATFRLLARWWSLRAENTSGAT